MILGIIANTSKENIAEIVSSIMRQIEENNLDFLLSDMLLPFKENFHKKVTKSKFANNDLLCKKSDIIVSIGGDGTMLASAYKAQFYNKPVLGVNIGKLGFLIEANVNQAGSLIKDIKKNRFKIEEKMVVTGECINHKCEKLYAINDIVIEKGGWPKMIELAVWVDGEYVTTLDADGLIIATPTGSTGYSISTGGPIVSPKADVITLSPISPHSLTVRPLVLPSNQEIVIRANSLYKEISVSCDGQRVYVYPPPLEIKIKKSERSLKIIHSSLTNYFETLRNKLLWGVDVRKSSINNSE